MPATAVSPSLLSSDLGIEDLCTEASCRQAYSNVTTCTCACGGVAHGLAHFSAATIDRLLTDGPAPVMASANPFARLPVADADADDAW